MPFNIKKAINLLDRKRDLTAENGDRSKDLFYGRILYDNYAYSSISSLKIYESLLPIRNFRIAENCFYGRISPDYHAIVPLPHTLVFVKEGVAASRYALTAFEALQSAATRDVASGKLPADIPYISDIQAHSGYDDINTKYNSWAKDALMGTFSSYVAQTGQDEKVVTFDSFMKIFEEHLTAIIEQVGAATFSSYCLSTRSSVKSSGLALDIADLDLSKDSDKIEFSSSPYFSYYVQLAHSFGFFVDYNAPWRLILDITSPVTMRRYDYDNLFSFFDLTSRNAYNDDLAVLKHMAFKTYTNYVTQSPSFRKSRVTRAGCPDDTYIIRQRLSLEEFEANYTDEYWLSFYISLKNKEKNLNFSQHQVAQIQKNAKEYKKHVDIQTAMRYINNIFQDLPAQEGSYYSLLTRAQYKGIGSPPFEDFDRYIENVVRSYKQI